MLYHKFIISNDKILKKKSKTKKSKISSKRYLSLNKNKFMKVQSLLLALDIEFGYYSYEKLRQLFCNLVTNDLYPIPSEGVALLEYKRILSQGMSTAVGKINSRILTQPDLLLCKFDIEDKNLLKDHPMFIAVYNTILKS